jgi:hypothetical protein
VLALLASSPSFSFLAGEELFVVCWKGAPTLESTRRLAVHLEKFAASCARPIGMLVVVDPHAPMPDQATRERMAADLKRHDTFTRQIALVYQGDGFRAAVLRSIVSGMNLLSKQRAKTGVFAEVSVAAAWLDLGPQVTREARQAIADAFSG